MQRLEKTRAFLTEFIIVILFFTISSVITVRLFVEANRKSVDSIVMTDGYLKAESIAEQIQAYIYTGKELTDNYMTEDLGYIKGEESYYYQYFDKDYNVTGKKEAYIYGYIKIDRETKEAGNLYSITVAFEDSRDTVSAIDFKVYEGEVR